MVDATRCTAVLHSSSTWPAQKLPCTCHVDCAWQENINQIQNRELAATVYDNLQVLLEETDVHTFKQNF